MSAKDIISGIHAVGEVRRLAEAGMKLFDFKKKQKLVTVENNMLQKDIKALVEAIEKHQKAMEAETYPRRFQCDIDLYEFAKKYKDPIK